MLTNVLIVVATVVAMEGVANLAHRYIMHGPGWGWHKSHHEETDGVFEKNDLYAVVFSVFAVALFAIGGAFWAPLFWIAAGITIYGFLYFVVHDGLVHRRWPFRHNPREPLPQAPRPGPSPAPRHPRARGRGVLRLPLRAARGGAARGAAPVGPARARGRGRAGPAARGSSR
jgi:hypothetical protein